MAVLVKVDSSFWSQPILWCQVSKGFPKASLFQGGHGHWWSSASCGSGICISRTLAGRFVRGQLHLFCIFFVFFACLQGSGSWTLLDWRCRAYRRSQDNAAHPYSLWTPMDGVNYKTCVLQTLACTANMAVWTDLCKGEDACVVATCCCFLEVSDTCAKPVKSGRYRRRGQRICSRTRWRILKDTQGSIGSTGLLGSLWRCPARAILVSAIQPFWLVQGISLHRNLKTRRWLRWQVALPVSVDCVWIERPTSNCWSCCFGCLIVLELLSLHYTQSCQL